MKNDSPWITTALFCFVDLECIDDAIVGSTEHRVIVERKCREVQSKGLFHEKLQEVKGNTTNNKIR
jgi:hypothetical protein